MPLVETLILLETYSGVCHDALGTHARDRIQVFGAAATNGKRRGNSTSDGANSNRIGQADHGEEETDANARGRLDSGGDSSDQPLAHAGEGKDCEDQAFEEDGGEGQRVRYHATSVYANDLVGKVCVDAHTGTV